MNLELTGILTSGDGLLERADTSPTRKEAIIVYRLSQLRIADSVFRIDLRHHQDIPPSNASHVLPGVESHGRHGVREATGGWPPQPVANARAAKEKKVNASYRRKRPSVTQLACSGMIDDRGTLLNFPRAERTRDIKNA